MSLRSVLKQYFSAVLEDYNYFPSRFTRFQLQHQLQVGSVLWPWTSGPSGTPAASWAPMSDSRTGTHQPMLDLKEPALETLNRRSRKPVQVPRDAGLGGTEGEPEELSKEGRRSWRTERGAGAVSARRKEQEDRESRLYPHRRTAAVSGEERSRSTAGQTEQLTGGFTSTAGNCCWRALKSCARPESNNNNKRKSN